MQDNFNIHNWRLTQAIKEMDEATFTDKHDDDPKLKGDQKDLPDELQAQLIKKEGYSSLSHVEEMESILDNLIRNTATNSTIPNESKLGLLRAFKELKGHIEDLGTEFEQDDEYASDYSRRRAKELYEGEDHEVSMAQNSLQSIISSASQLMSKLGDNERNIPGWIQDHITNAENYIEQANQGFHELDNEYEED